ncbi:MAG: hypothetical protein FWD71_03440 [Oscillospiraceae bacterium]|nr:hypothetical protein [Oscillospiraceae bacterium]
MKTTVIQPHKSSLGMDANIAVLLTYIIMAVVSWIPYIGYISWAVPIVIFFMEKESKFVKFQAVQALIIGIVREIIAIIFAIIVWAVTPKDIVGILTLNSWGAAAFVGGISVIVGLAITVLVIYVIVKAYGYKQIELPMIAPIAAKASEKLENMNINFNQNQNQQNNMNQNQQNNSNSNQQDQQNQNDSNNSNNTDNQP